MLKPGDLEIITRVVSIANIVFSNNEWLSRATVEIDLVMEEIAFRISTQNKNTLCRVAIREYRNHRCLDMAVQYRIEHLVKSLEEYEVG